MDSILEFDSQETKQIKRLLKSQEGLMDFFNTNCAQLFETAFLMLLSSGAKQENFTFMH